MSALEHNPSLRPAHAPATWVVVLEAADPGDGAILDLALVEDLVEHLREFTPGALYSPDRYALQLSVEGTTPDEALRLARSVWGQAVISVGLPGWPLARVEVMTPAELAQQSAPEGPAIPVLDGVDDPEAAVLDVTRGLLRAENATQVVHLLIRLVHRLGGKVASPEEAGDKGLALDIGLGVRPPLVPVAEPLSIARMRLEEALPVVLADARSVVDRLEQEALARQLRPAVAR